MTPRRETLTSRVDLPAPLAAILDELAQAWGCNRASVIASIIAGAVRRGLEEAIPEQGLTAEIAALCRRRRPDVRFSWTQDRDEVRRQMQGFLISATVDIWERKKGDKS